MKLPLYFCPLIPHQNLKCLLHPECKNRPDTILISIEITLETVNKFLKSGAGIENIASAQYDYHVEPYPCAIVEGHFVKFHLENISNLHLECDGNRLHFIMT